MPHRAGFAAIVGRPNVGKSTLLNALVGTKVAIVTPKPQTTRNRIAGIRTLPEAQIAFLDTPGMHEARSLLNRRMVDVARQTLGEADVVLLFLQTEEEVPYGTAVEVEEFAEKPERNLLFLRATIVVDRPTHKGIVIGTDGQRLREIGRRARLGLERLFGVRVFLELFVRVETGWARNPRRLRELGL